MTKEQYINNVCLQLIREEMADPAIHQVQSKAFAVIRIWIQMYDALPRYFTMSDALHFAKQRLGMPAYMIATPETFSKLFRKFFTEDEEKGFYHDETTN